MAGFFKSSFNSAILPSQEWTNSAPSSRVTPMTTGVFRACDKAVWIFVWPVGGIATGRIGNEDDVGRFRVMITGDRLADGEVVARNAFSFQKERKKAF
jgi:hypothetical protein